MPRLPSAAAVSTPLAAPVVGAVRLRGGNASTSRGAASLAAQAIWDAPACGADWTIVVQMDSACYAAAVIAAVRGNGARFSVAAPVTAAIRAAIAAIPEDAWTAIEYPQAVWEDQLGCWVSDAEVAETNYAAFTSKKKELHVTARLIVRRFRDKNPKAAPGEGELFHAWRYHAVFTDSPFELVQAEEQHRSHAIIEQLLADLNDGPLADLPSGKFNANATPESVHDGTWRETRRLRQQVLEVAYATRPDRFRGRRAIAPALPGKPCVSSGRDEHLRRRHRERVHGTPQRRANSRLAKFQRVSHVYVPDEFPRVT
jgi:hypothetical protein